MNSGVSNELVQKNKPEQIDVNQVEDSDFSFWNWFKGLVSPIQNLPLISGIYSSMNSDDVSSDRDLVQNSLGGFLYGGPIGAIAGFGNWFFNKIFDKTPSELALDATGISDLWKDDKQTEESEITLAGKNVNDKNSLAMRNDVGEWWRNGKPLVNNISQNAKEKMTNIANKIPKGRKEISDEVTLVEFKDKNFDLQRKSPNESQNIKLTREQSILQDHQKHELKNTFEIKKDISTKDPNLVKIEDTTKKPQIKKEDGQQFREINFNYPSWKPSQLKIKDEIIENSTNSSLKEKYFDLRSMDNESTLNIDA
jgi:hypothetical protein